MEWLSYLQFLVQNTVIACPQNKYFGGGHGGKNSMNNKRNLKKNQIYNPSGAQHGLFQCMKDF